MGTEENVAASVNDERDDLETMSNEETRSQCKALAKATGKRCKKTASPGSEYCSVHQRMAERRAQQANTERTPPEEKTEVTRNPKETPISRWHPHAEFSVFFDYEIDEHGEQVWQTRVYHNESGDTDELPIEAAPWVNWILERAKLPDTARPVPAESEVSAPPAPVTPYDVQLKILNVQVSEIGPSPDVPEKKLVAEVRFQISGPEAETLTAKRIPFRIEVHTVDLESGASNLIARERSQLQPKLLKSSQQKLEFPVPKLGRHELHTIVLLLPPGEMMAYHRGPTIKVVP